MTIFQDAEQALLRNPVYGIVTGQFIGFDSGQTPLVTFPGQQGDTAKAARTVVDLRGTLPGAELVLQFDQGDVERPIVLGIIRQPVTLPELATGEQVEVEADGRRLLVTAGEEILLRCGHASIRLTASGKVLINGTYLSSRATGTHRIKGGSVQIN